ncbi:MAG: CHAT domain-containing protein [Bacteroidales bacterium]|nr:CHAT domain-containing protein [Bacteroidales bacterium]
MKILKTILSLAIIICMIQISNAQNITTETTLANKFFVLGDKFYNQNCLDSSNIYYQKAAEIYKIAAQKNNDTLMWKKHIQLMYYVAWNLTSLSEFNNSINVSNKILSVSLKYLGENHKQTVDIYNGLANVYNIYISEYDLALQCYLKALQISKEIFGETHTYVADIYNNIGNVYANINEYDLALLYQYKALQLRKELFSEKHILVARSYNDMGIIYSDKSEFDSALQYYFEALDIYRELLGEKHNFTAITYNNIGNVYVNKNEYDLALQYHFVALQIRKDLLGEKHINVAASYNNIGVIYADKREYDLALKYYFKSVQIKKEQLGEKHISIAISYDNIGGVYADKKEFDSALEYYFKALQITKNLFGEKHTLVATSYNNIGLVNKYINKYDLALEYYFKSLQIFKELLGEKYSHVATEYINIGDVYVEKNEYDLALKNYQKGIVASLRNFNDTINLYSVPIINDYLNWDELLKALQEKAEIFADTSITLPKFETSAKLKLALRHYQACDTLISQVRKNMKTKSDKIALGTIADEVYKGAVDVCLDLVNSTDVAMQRLFRESAFYFSEKNKSSVLLESLAGSEAQKFAGIPDTLLKQEHKLQIDIALYKKILAEEPDSLKEIRFQDKLFKANRTYDSLIIVFEQKFPKYYELKYNQKPAGVADIQQILDKHTAILSYFEGDSMISVFIINKKKFNIIQVEKTKDFNDIITELRENISNTDIITEDYSNNTHYSVDIYQKNAYELYQLLFPKEVKKYLNRKIKNLIIIPDGKLAIIPFESLLTKKYNASWTDWKNTDYFSEMPYLVKDYNISYSYSGNLFYKTNPKTTDKPEFQNISDWLALAPVFDNDSISGTNLRTRKLIEKNSTDQSGNLNTRAWLRDGSYITPLPGSEEETKEIFNIFESNNKKAILKTHKFANEEFVKSGVLKDFKYLHIATHGMVNEDKPELSCILLAQDTTSTEDNILFSGEIYNLELNADLTVLSACETGLGKIAEGEGVIGLTRALLYAGSKNVIVSLWQVSDESTNQLMVDFYSNFLNEKTPPLKGAGVMFADHLSKSKLKLINEGKYAHPFFWSPFVLIGR